MIKIFFIYLILVQVFGDVIINLDLQYQCDCESLLYASECKMKKCEWTNDGKCTTIACEEHLDRNSCKSNLNCAWYQDKCSTFTQCSSYKVDSSIDCENLSSTCHWSTFNTCVDHEPSLTCQELQHLNCDVGKQGKCIEIQGICKEFTTCEDAAKNEALCKQASPACYSTFIDGNHYCPSIMTCKDQLQFGCVKAKNRINGYEYTVCEKESEEQCKNWDIATANLESCVTKTNYNYHWVDNECKKCEQSPPLAGFLISSFLIWILME
ncbi:unnamed protein product (macronuclear) [Paramecium tetraurelia]|uniref:Mini antigen n=1 Tax=Paramecium tetraurelia TaxID=5888 RepID=A0CIH3_PARTE|nr:uncharacterized protein GSPATT00007725001 [Paramecium tetraurelia]CAK70590.1 unnamed protein product [Paramecium tetraurelia]|eukprot:XP_001437987.1 hypothetical protein (macronuclear) [Paramecium tetraurelia strain d4-2]